MFKYLNNIFSSLHHPTENSVMDDIIAKHMTGLFQQYIPKKENSLVIILLKLCGSR
jgi:hypothetical protein